jgi:hypothetical protein
MSLADYPGRTTGQFPLSVATSLAIEAALGIYPERPVDPAPILEYEELWINLRTLFRNLHGSFDKGVADTVMPETFAEALNDEMSQIHEIITHKTNGLTKVVYYISDYADIDKKYPYAVTRRDNTPKQKLFTATLKDSIALLLKMHPESNIRKVRLKLRPEHKTKAMILTHIAFDLISYVDFKELVLLESHTGAVKSRSAWFTKYYEGKNLTMVPFREDFLQIFGDNEFFRPADRKLRQEILDIAVKYRWSPVTTDEKIKYGINQLKNPYALEVLRSIMA